MRNNIFALSEYDWHYIECFPLYTLNTKTRPLFVFPRTREIGNNAVVSLCREYVQVDVCAHTHTHTHTHMGIISHYLKTTFVTVYVLIPSYPAIMHHNYEP